MRARAHTLACIRDALPGIDVLVFTLGLTEGWEHVAGYAYPMCPGTVRSRFDADLHRFVNHSSHDVVTCLDATMNRLREVRPGMGFMLTVSPVPLTATATGGHVLSATTLAKSVLRSAAGELMARRDDVDYFPSYELIAGCQSGGRYYEANLRSVRSDGVDFVMRHFAAGLGVAGGSEATSAQPPAAPVEAPTQPDAAADGEVSCEEALLESFARATGAAAAGPLPASRLCLLGDSHMTFLSRALQRRGIGNVGRFPHGDVDTEQALAYYRRLNRERLGVVKAVRARGFRVIVLTDPPMQSRNPRMKPYLVGIEAYESLARHALAELGCETYSVRDLMGVTGFDGNEARYYRPDPNETGGVDWIHGCEAWYDGVLDALLPLIGPAPADALAA
ncbi:MAG: GSCFA domain-containing protein [Vitreoscilla sp.]|nr:GSCFA domain-containing protein [Vitreoscilla sp.]